MLRGWRALVRDDRLPGAGAPGRHPFRLGDLDPDLSGWRNGTAEGGSAGSRAIVPDIPSPSRRAWSDCTTDVERWQWIRPCGGQAGLREAKQARWAIELIADLPVSFGPDGADADRPGPYMPGCRMWGCRRPRSLGRDFGDCRRTWRGGCLRLTWIRHLIVDWRSAASVFHVMGFVPAPASRQPTPRRRICIYGARLLDSAVMEAARAGGVNLADSGHRQASARRHNRAGDLHLPSG